MARIRNIKPSFFRHEALQDLEAQHMGKCVMLTYIGLWTQCDAAGIFPWKPRILKLDILPFLDYEIEVTLQILHDHGFIMRYRADGAEWGYIPTFDKHQRITGKEATEGEKYPKPGENKPGSTGETPGKQSVAQERSTGKDNREGVYTRAHEEADQNSKNQNAIDPNPFADTYNAISEWAETDEGHNRVVEMKKITGYRDSQHGPTTDELSKFVSWHLGAKNTPEGRAELIAHPIPYFLDRFPGWLTNAKTMNRPPAMARGKPPQNAREYTPRRPAGHSSSPAHISSLIAPLAP